MSRYWSYAVVLIALAGCGSDLAAPTVEQVEQEVGLWWAANWTFSSVTDPAMQRELTETGYEGHVSRRQWGVYTGIRTSGCTYSGGKIR